MEWAHEQGFRSYDSGGAGKPGVAYGVRDFKAKFGGQLVNYGRYQKVYSPWKLAVAERAYELGRRLLSLRSRGK
jgi:lipid II:glycine glycyltransferase (peptidoglycan interpeptide bridge formation enzyme)